MKIQRILLASVATLLSTTAAQAVDYNFGPSVTENFTFFATDQARALPGGTAAGVAFNDNAFGGVYDRGSERDATYMHFDLSWIAGGTINGTVNLSLTIDATFGGAINGGIVGSANSAWSFPGNTPGLTTISGADPSGNYSSGQIATAVIDNATFQGFASNLSGFHGLGVTAGGGSTAHFSGPAVLTGSATTGTITVGGATDWSAAVFNSGTTTLSISGANDVSGGSVAVRAGGTISVTDSATLGGGSFTGRFSNAGVLSFGSSANQTLSGTIIGTGSLTKAGTGTLTLSGGNSYSGGTTATAGVLKAGTSSAFGDSGAAISIGSGASLDINGQTLQGYTQNINIAGAGADPALGALGNSGGQNLNAIRGITLTGNATVGASAGRWDIGRIDFNADPNNTVNHIDGGGFVLTKVGAGDLGLLTGSTNLAGFVVSAGRVLPHENTSFGAGPVTVESGATVRAWGGLTQANAFTLNSGILAQEEGFNDFYTGTIAVNGTSSVNVGSGSITISGAMSGAGSLSKTGGSTLRLSGNNTQTGTLSVNGGHVRFGSTTGNATRGNVELLSPGSFLIMEQANQFGPNAGLLFNSSGGHNEFALYGQNQTIASLASTNQFAVVQNSHGGFGAAGASSTLTVNQNSDTTYTGVLRNNTGNDAFTLALVKSGEGKLTLATNTQHTGGTTVDYGVLEIAGSGGGNGNLRGTVTVNTGGELRYTGGDGTGFGYQNGNKIDTLNIVGGLVSSPSTTHVWNATVNMTGGELRSNNGISDPNGPQFEWGNASVNTNASADTATISGRIRIRPDASPDLSFSVADGAAATDLLVSAAITENGGSNLIKGGAGTLTLTGTNNYTGNTTINGGTLKIAEGASIYNGGYNSSAILTVNNGATLELNRWGYGPGGDNQSLGGLDYNPARFVINGGTVKFTGGAAGAPTNPAESPYGPGFTIGALGATLDAAKVNDTWTVKHDSRGAGPITSNDGGTLTLTGIGNGIFDKELGGTGGVVMNGSATWTLNRASSYTGTTSVNAGTLLVTGSISGSAVTVNNGGTLGGTGTTGAVTALSGATLSPGASPGVLSTGSLSMSTGSILNIEINGLTLGTQYDQLSVTGTVDITGATLSLSGSYLTTPAITNDLFTILLNDGNSDAITGTFAGLTEGAHVFSGLGQDYTISYIGGDGNDIVLTAVPEPGSAALMLGGLGALLGLRRRRRA